MNFLKTCFATVVLFFCYFQVKAQRVDFKVLEPVFAPIGYETGIESIEVYTAFDNLELGQYDKYVLGLPDDNTIYKPLCRFDHDEKYSSLFYLEISELPGYLPSGTFNMQTIDKIKGKTVAKQTWVSKSEKNLRQHFQDLKMQISSYKENGVIYFLGIDKDRTIKRYFDVEKETYYTE
jgi:hypothetical protein